MKYYVTLFDSNYLTRGLVMYRSLMKYESECHLWIICFDDLAYKILNKLALEKVTLISLEEFEDEDLLRVKPGRSQQEYCWTCTPSSVLHILKTQPQVDTITYLDADLMFFSSPEPIFQEIGNASILLIEHRYVPGLDPVASTGIYNVQFMCFRRDPEALRALNWWRDRCIEWCFARIEENKYGDQKYLDDWPNRFRGVHVLQHLGAGVGPWNAANYYFSQCKEQIFVENYPLIFYHFHGFVLHPLKIACLYHHYPINDDIKTLLYQAYLQEINKAYVDVRKLSFKFKRGIVRFPKFSKRPRNLYNFLKFTWQEIVEGRYSIYG